MVYSIICIPSENILQLKWFKSDTACSEYHDIIAWQWPDALIKREKHWSLALKTVQKFSINLKE